MDWKRRSRQLHLSLLIKQNSGIIALLAGWFVVNFLILAGTCPDVRHALLVLTFFETPTTAWGTWYQNMSDFVIFGLVVGVVMVDVQRRYRPEVTCRVLAQEMHDHAVVLSYSHLGQRVVELLDHFHLPSVVVEADRSLVEDLIRQERPLVLGSGRQRTDLEAASVARARLVVLAPDDLETISVTASLVRQMNPDCALVCRCYDDDIGEVLAKRYKATVISVSRLAADFIKEYSAKHKVRHAVIVGGGHVGRRLVAVMKTLGAEYRLIETRREIVEDLMENEPILIGSASDPDVLREAEVERTDLVVLTDDNLSHSLPVIDHVRDMNTGTRIVCRVFQDDAADMITREPFCCDVISTSRYAVEHLARQGVFRALGVDQGVAVTWTAVRQRQGSG
ncbi:MAG: NAD-binding protein [Candidatus Eremiobacterota bacterium]